MTPRDRISAAIRSASKSGDPAIVAFLTAGFPRKDRFRETLKAVAAGSDVVEIGVPFTDPMADGVTIQRSSQVALEQGVSLRWILEELAVDAAARYAAAADELSQSAACVWARQSRGDRRSGGRVRIHRAGSAGRRER